jgi:hypothetical protein
MMVKELLIKVADFKRFKIRLLGAERRVGGQKVQKRLPE